VDPRRARRALGRRGGCVRRPSGRSIACKVQSASRRREAPVQHGQHGARRRALHAALARVIRQRTLGIIVTRNGESP
jgi:hypothetical protein